ncbi:MAG: DUF982 domain-containing protein [Proteobacteria bacterium]|nr:DUF982 domain-containing protein [Pseudomonadota bacterium]
MPLHWFATPVYVDAPEAGGRYAVTNIERAAEFLLEWRDEAARAEWRRAVAICMSNGPQSCPPIGVRPLRRTARR